MKKIYDMLDDLGICMSYRGYAYLAEAIKSCSGSKPFPAFGKELYPEIAKKFGCKLSCIDRCIRTITEIYYNKNGKFKDLFKDENKAPSNGHMIGILVSELRRRTDAEEQNE